MSTRSEATALIARKHSGPEGAEQTLKELGIKLLTPPEPFGNYVEAVKTGKLLFLTGIFLRKATGRNSLGVSAWSSMWRRDAKQLVSLRSMCSLLRGSI